MPPVNGGVDEETYRLFEEHVIDDGSIDSESEAVEHCIRYTLSEKYNLDV